MMDRKELQETAVFLLERTHRLICQWATGTGKTNVAIEFIRRHPDSRCLILVPEQNNIDNWKTEFSKFGVFAERVFISCYASLHKYENTSWDLIVFDEAPHIDTDKRKSLCSTIKGEYILALGAKIDDDEKIALESNYGEFYTTTVTLEDAVKCGILPNPTIIVCHMQLDDSFAKYYHMGIRYTAKGMYKKLNDEVDAAVAEYNNKSNAINKRRMLRLGNERKRFLGRMKDDALMFICKSLESKNRRFLCFCSSIRQAKLIGGKNAFTSQTPVSMKMLDRFNNHEINSLFVVSKLIEGQNLVDIECGVIGQLGGTDRITIQSVGRIMRSKSPIIYVPVFDGTKDDSFLYTLTSNISKDYIKHYNFNLK